MYLLHIFFYSINQGNKKRTFTVTYKCCAGFGRRRSVDTNAQCNKLELENLDKTVESLGAKEFMRSAKKILTEEEMSDVTVFAPIDASFSEFSERMFENVSTIATFGYSLKQCVFLN